MSFWSYKLTDTRSARIRFILSLLRSLPWVAAFWLVEPRPALVLIFAGALCYMSALEFVIDHWRLRRPDVSAESLFKRRFPAVLVLMLSMIGLIFLFT